VNLGPGDLLDIALFDLPDLSTQVRVTSDGEITFPLLGKLQVLGMTPLQVQDLIRARLVSGDFVKDPQVAVFVSEYANQSVYVLGEVNKPGAYPLLGAHRLYDFISAASGFTLLAGKSITITRIADPLTPETVHFSRDPDFAGGNPQIAAGDTVYVGKAGVIYVVGEVNKAGGFLMVSAESMTVMEALATAEGAKPTAALGSVRLIRKTDQGRTETTLNVNQIFQLHGPDMVLHDQDILYVPRSAARVGVQTFLTYGVGAALGAAIYRF
jgi:polysaccharide export outer membrane protein